MGASELNLLRRMRFPKRRADWLLGRWTAKTAVASFFSLPADLPSLGDIEILPTTSGAPEVFFRAEPAAISISLSHRDGVALCFFAPLGVLLGCDLETMETRSDAFASVYFAAEEQAPLNELHLADRTWFLTLLWSAKESTLKVLREGLRLDPRHIVVTLPDIRERKERNGKWLAHFRFEVPRVGRFKAGGLKQESLYKPL